MNAEAAFGIEYDKLPAKLAAYPDIFFMFYCYFENNLEDFRNVLFLRYKLSESVRDNVRYPKEEMILIFDSFIKLIKELPSPFIPHYLTSLYLSNPCKESAFAVLTALPESKYTCLSRFIKILEHAKLFLIHPLDYDKNFGLLFCKKDVPFLFNYLTRQNNMFLIFPLIKHQPFICPKPVNEYPDLDNMTATCDASKSIDFNPYCSLSDIYEEARDHANYLGLNYECLGEIDLIPLKDAKVHNRYLKIVIKDFEERFRLYTKREPTKEEKEPLSILYHLKHKLKKRCLRNKYEDLIKEKELLQKDLNEFRIMFEKKYGRTIMYESDKKAVKEKYERYKQIKAKIAQNNQ